MCETYQMHFKIFEGGTIVLQDEENYFEGSMWTVQETRQNQSSPRTL